MLRYFRGFELAILRWRGVAGSLHFGDTLFESACLGPARVGEVPDRGRPARVVSAERFWPWPNETSNET